MPDANAPVRLARLHSVTSDHFWALVAFPAGWQRLRPGHYSVDEDFLLLQGDLTINGLTWGRDTHGVVPAHTLRQQTQSQHGCVACARFHGRPQWHSGASMAKPFGVMVQSSAWTDVAPADGQGQGLAHVLWVHNGFSHGVLPNATLQAWHAQGMEIDALDLSALDAASSTGLPNAEPTHFHWARWPNFH